MTGEGSPSTFWNWGRKQDASCQDHLYQASFFHYDFKLKRDLPFNEFFLYLFQFHAAGPSTKFALVCTVVKTNLGVLFSLATSGRGDTTQGQGGDGGMD